MTILKSVIEDTDTRAGKIFDICIQTLIFASLVALSIGTIPDLPTKTMEGLQVFEIRNLKWEIFVLDEWNAAHKNKI